jgi:hypothetical protein
MKIARGVCTAAMLLMAPAVSAEPVEIGQVAQGAIYYNRPGGSLAEHNEDLRSCIADTQLKSSDDPTDFGRSLIFQLMWSGPIAGVRAVAVENCMLVRGWRAVRVPDVEAAKLMGLNASDLSREMSPWIAADQPHGDIARVWDNDALHPGAYKTASRARTPAKNHLSLQLFALSGEALPVPPAFTQLGKVDAKWPTKSLQPAEISSAPPGSALIVMRATGPGNRFGGAPVLVRQGATPEDYPSKVDHAPDLLMAPAGRFGVKKDGFWFVFAVPAGRWIVARSGFVGHCLGAPSFAVDAGEVVYAGTFHIEGPDLTPDLNIQPARDYLSGPAASAVRPAGYRNGDRLTCRGFGINYALEFPGAPFAPGYSWGSAYKSAPKRP